MQINLNVQHTCPNQLCAPTFTVTDRDTVCLSLCLFPLCPLVFSYHTAIVLLALARLINFLFLRGDAHVTFPAGAHTVMLSTAPHPGYKNTGSSLGVSCMEKKSPSLSSQTPHCTWRLIRGLWMSSGVDLHSRCSKLTPVIFRSMFEISSGNVNASVFKSCHIFSGDPNL